MRGSSPPVGHRGCALCSPIMAAATDQQSSIEPAVFCRLSIAAPDLLAPNQRKSRTLYPDRTAGMGLCKTLVSLKPERRFSSTLDRLLQRGFILPHLAMYLRTGTGAVRNEVLQVCAVPSLPVVSASVPFCLREFPCCSPTDHPRRMVGGISPRSMANRSVRGLTSRNAAASVRFNHGCCCCESGLWQGMR
jgi:hypothetical protein